MKKESDIQEQIINDDYTGGLGGDGDDEKLQILYNNNIDEEIINNNNINFNQIEVQDLSNAEVNRTTVPEYNLPMREGLYVSEHLRPEDVIRCKSWRNGLLQ
jgi:hypothetical protein